MNRLQTYYEELQLPIKTLFVSSVLIAIGSILGNPFLRDVLRIDLPIITVISNLLLFTGGTILSCFPFYVFIKLLQLRIDDKNIVIVGVISYVVFLIMVFFFAPQNLPSNAYSTIFKSKIGETDHSLLNTGVFGLIGVYLLVKRTYRRKMSMKYSNLTTMLDADLIRMIRSIFLAGLLGLAFAYFWPYVIESIYSSLRFVASDYSNPMSLFAFGGLERLLSLGNLDTIIHKEMWFGSLGGTWNSLDNTAYIGDVNIWAAQLKANLAVLGIGSAGRYSTIHYVINIFSIPGYLAALGTTVSDRKRFRRILVAGALGIVLSITSGISFPVEIIMLLTTPVLYIFHLFMVSLVSAILLGLSVTLGFSYLGVLNAANPGNIIDLVALSRHQLLGKQIMMLMLLGAIVFFIYFIMTRVYYTRMAMDILNVGSKDDEIKDFIERVGGLDNITSISSTPTRILLSLKNEDEINVGGLHRQGVTRIVQSRQGYILSYGSGSYMLQRDINRKIEERKTEVLKDESI